MPENFDVVIIGGGLAGLMAGKTALENGLSAIIIEKKSEIGLPLNCAEGVTIGSIKSILTVNKSWVRTTIDKVKIISPSGNSFTLNHPDAGYILNRPFMEKEIAEKFVASGGVLRMNCQAEQLISSGNKFVSLSVKNKLSDNGEEISGSIFIAADGVESSIARKAGANNRLMIHETESFLQYRLSKIDVDPRQMEIHIGSKLAPHSYLWIFPSSNKEAVVGLGVNSVSELSPKKLLDKFILKRFSISPERLNKSISIASCGTSPRYMGDRVLAHRNLLVTGDAGRLLDSVTGAGIANALLSGKMASEASVKFLQEGTKNWTSLHDLYPGEFLKKKGKELKRYRQIKDLFDRLTDDDFDIMVESLNKIFGTKKVDSVNSFSVFLAIIKKTPRLLKLARHII